MTLTEIDQKIATFSIREKILLGLSIIFCLMAIWDIFFFSPYTQQKKMLTSDLGKLKTQLISGQQTALRLKSTTQTDPAEYKKNSLNDLQQQITLLQQKIMVSGKKFVSPGLMAKALSDVLSQNNHIKLIKLDTVAATSLSSTLEKLKVKAKQQIIYRHGLVLTFTADYQGTMRYLNTLETLPWRFIWDSIDYRVKTYPNAEVTLQVYTLSFDEQWLDI
jgi:MSHA biogenesis protein MshJ